MRVNRSASVLIMVILMLSLMVTVAIGFMSMVGRQMGSAIGIAGQTMADVAARNAQAHAIKCFLESVEETRNGANVVVNYTTAYNPSWRKEFAAVSDPDGDPFTEDGLPLVLGTSSTADASTTQVSNSPIVNSDYVLFDMMGISTTGEKHYARNYGYGYTTDGDDHPVSRWHNVQYLTEKFERISIDDSLSENDKALLRKSARYVVRYVAQVMDVHGMRNINHNFPLELQSGTHVVRGSGAVDDLQYIRLQNYLRCYGRSIKSQVATQDKNHPQTRSNELNFLGVDPLDHESVGIYHNGDEAEDYYSGGHALDYDIRLRFERAFRQDLQWMNGSLYNNGVLTTAHKGRLYTFGHMSETLMGPAMYTNFNTFLSFVPYGDSLADAQLSDPALVSSNAVPVDEVSTPWNINLLSASPKTIGAMICGLSSHLNFHELTDVNSSWESRGSAADMFGKGYPEPFPISLDSGRDVPLMGDGIGDNATDGPIAYEMESWRKNGGTYALGVGANRAAVGNQNSYIADIAIAVGLAIRDARRVWGEERALETSAQVDYVNPDGTTLYLYRGGVNNSYIDASEHDPDDMIGLILRETYRILGEGTINPAVAPTTPASSVNFENAAVQSLLGGGTNFVGSGSDRYSDGYAHYQRVAKLSVGTNTRAMEYVLNDFMISLFGKANPHYVYNPSNPYGNLSDIAVDFNNDGYAESTITGYWDHENNRRLWSWWWDGLGPYVEVSAQNEYMKQPGWYRFDGSGTVFRKVGHEWLAVPDSTAFAEYNDLWLTGNNAYPIKPFAKTGRFFIGKSKVFYTFVRGEVYNLLNNTTLAARDRHFAYRVDPDEDGDFSDSHMLIQLDATMSSK